MSTKAMDTPGSKLWGQLDYMQRRATMAQLGYDIMSAQAAAEKEWGALGYEMQAKLEGRAEHLGMKQLVIGPKAKSWEKQADGSFKRKSFQGDVASELEKLGVNLDQYSFTTQGALYLQQSEGRLSPADCAKAIVQNKDKYLRQMSA